MEPVEELFDNKNDPLELKNMASSPDHLQTLEEMRLRYTSELEKWKRHAVDYNNYQRYGTLFDRDVPISQKQIKKKKPKKKPKKKIEA